MAQAEMQLVVLEMQKLKADIRQELTSSLGHLRADVRRDIRTELSDLRRERDVAKVKDKLIPLSQSLEHDQVELVTPEETVELVFERDKDSCSKAGGMGNIDLDEREVCGRADLDDHVTASRVNRRIESNYSGLDVVQRIGTDAMEKWETLTKWCNRLMIPGSCFDYIMGVVILLSTISIGMETQFSLEPSRGEELRVLEMLEHVFLVIFILEILINLQVKGKKSFSSGWFRLDLLVVVLGVANAWIIRPILDSSDVPVLEHVMVVRSIRLLRLARALRLLEHMQELWKLVVGMLNSLKTVLSALVLILMMLFLFGCVSVELITKSETLRSYPDAARVVDTHFYSLWASMMTFARFANADSMSELYTPLITAMPTLVPFFLLVWIMVTVSLMNLVAALLVLNAIDEARVDEEYEMHQMRRKLKKLVPSIKRIFEEIDVNNDKSLEIDEIRRGIGQVSVPGDLKHVIHSDKLIDLFDFLDQDGSGHVDQHEFVDGVCHLALSRVPIETTQTLSLLRRTAETADALMEEMHQEQSRSWKAAANQTVEVPGCRDREDWYVLSKAGKQ
jgi:voltage-gated sodium channel